MDPTWQALREAFPIVQLGQHAEPLDDDGRRFVRGSRYSGKARILRRLELGVISSLELEDASPVSSALAELQRWGVRVAEREADRAQARRARYLELHGSVPRWVERGMASRLERAEQVHHRVQMLLGTFGAHGVLPLEFKPAHSVGDLLLQHLDDLEQEAEEKGGVGAVVTQHFAKVYKAPAHVRVPPAA